MRSTFKELDQKHGTIRIKKSAIALAVAAAMLPAAGAFAAYMDPGVIGNTAAAKASWETPEYEADWGLRAMNASSAYALGFHGQGVKVGVMDSGALLFKHPELNGDRFHATHASGVYGTSGKRYPDGSGTDGTFWGKYGDYTAGDKFDVTGEWVKDVNNNHGTHVTGTVGANRDGSAFHGVSWGSDIYVGNTGATDNNNYGPFQDYNFFYAGWKALVDSGVQVINNSWGTNTRIVNDGSRGDDNGSTGIHLPANTTAESEYEYFYHNKVYGTDKSFVNAAWDAVKGTGVVQIMTTGNRDFRNPFYRPLFPYFNPEAEQNWIAVAGLQRNAVKDGNGVTIPNTYTYSLYKTFNEAGNAKWWTVVAPGSGIYGSTVDDKTGDPGFMSASGTSMAAPHVAGAMGVLLSRYMDMTGTQARDVMFTTANNKNADGSFLLDWTAVDGTPDVRYGWGIPDLDKGMFGPGQFLGHFDYNMATTPLDVWTNAITQTALEARKVEDLAWLADYKANGIKAGGDYVLGDGFVVQDGNTDTTDHIISQADAEKWRAEYYAKRAAAIQAKLDGGLYEGSLTKRGAGSLVMTGKNTYTGGTTVEGGSLYGFTESFGTGGVEVNGGKFGVINSYNDTLTQKGLLKTTTTATKGTRVDINVNAGGTYVVNAGDIVNVGKMVFKEGSMITVGSDDVDLLTKVYRDGSTATGTVISTDLSGAEKAMVTPDYAFFNTTVDLSKENTLSASLNRNKAVNFATYANNANGTAIANALESSATGALYGSTLKGTKAEVSRTYDSLGSDFYLNAQNASILNMLSMARSVKDQAIGTGNGRTAESADGKGRLWVAGFYNGSDVDYGQSGMDVDSKAALLGGELDVTKTFKLGAYLGTGTTEFKGEQYGQIESDDIHFGLYGLSKIGDVAAVTYGLNYTRQDRDSNRVLLAGDKFGFNSINGNADIAQVFVEGAYTGLNTATYSVEPYLGLSWMRIKTDGFNESAGDLQFATDVDSQNLQIASLGVRGSLPFTAGSAKMTVKGDVYGMHFFGDTASTATMRLAGSGVAALSGGELKNLFGLGLGVDAQLTKSVTIGVSYAGMFDGDVTSNGIYAKVNYNF